VDEATGEPGLSRAESQAAIEAQNWKLLGYFNYYRLAIALAAVGTGLLAAGASPFGSSGPALFRTTGVLYALLSAAGVYTVRRRRFNFETHATVFTFADIVLLTVLMHASGGQSSGLGMLLVVAVAGASLMLPRRMTVFYASLAAIAAILEHSWGLLTGRVGSIADIAGGYPRVGMLGAGFFVTAFLGYTLAGRLRATEALAERRGVDLANLTQLNELIIQRLQLGVLVCDRRGNIRLLNRTARKFLGLNPMPAKLPALSAVAPDLAAQLHRSPGGGRHVRRTAVATSTGYQVYPRFLSLGEDSDAGTLVFLEDVAILKQQAQQMKMASLARLTASIAHEIRNPLGAISNAAQLLGETAEQNAEERKLIKIIQDQSRRMNAIVENVTRLSRRDRVNPRRFALAPWLREFARQYADTAQAPHGVFALAGDGDVEVCIDPEQLHQVVSNLCQNALRHSPPFSGTPLVKLETGVNAEQQPYLDVTDRGTGVPAEIAEFIFDPFFTTAPKGTGLGLYIAKEMCEGNGATLDYHPGEGGIGSRFRITFARSEDRLETQPA
jgi:two-component system sensor histidine kinase PilS (NtrC family)